MGDGGRGWKRSDVTTGMLCHAVHVHEVYALDVLAARGIPTKVLVAAVLRDVRNGYLNYGVSVWRPFLDWRGIELVNDALAVLRHE